MLPRVVKLGFLRLSRKRGHACWLCREHDLHKIHETSPHCHLQHGLDACLAGIAFLNSVSACLEADQVQDESVG